MRNGRKWLVFAVTIVPLAIPLIVNAQSIWTGITCSGTDCQACNLVQLFQNIINFAILIAIPIAAALFAYAGFLYMTSAANPGSRDTAKKIFSNAGIGFLIALCGWLIVNTLLYTLIGSQYQNSSWFSISCVTSGRQTNATLAQLFAQLQGQTSSSVTSPSSSGSTYTCPSGDTLGTDDNCYDSETGELDTAATLTPPSSSGSTYTCPSGDTLGTDDNCYDSETGELDTAATLTPTPTPSNSSGPTTEYQSCINGGGTASSCEPYIIDISTNGQNDSEQSIPLSPTRSDTDLGSTFTNVTSSYAPQIVAACSQSGIAIPNCETVAAAMITVESSGSGTNVMQVSPSTASYVGATCDTSASSQCSISAGVSYLNQLYLSTNDLPNAIAAYNSGASSQPGQSASGLNSALVPSTDCSGLYAWQCGINPGGLSVTQAEVANVCETMNIEGSTCTE